jgi:aminoglycoside phosphotransferase (APT) family kinase protein
VTDVPDEILRWAAGVDGPGAQVTHVAQLRTHSGPWLVSIERDGAVTEAILKSGPAVDWRSEYACEAAGLAFASQRGIHVPRLLGGRLDGDPVALLIERLPGTTDIPAAPDAQRAGALGEAAASIHRIPLRPSDRLPLRERHTSWTDFSTWRRWARRYRETTPSRRDPVLGDFVTQHPGWTTAAARTEFESIASTPLLDAADERVHRARPSHRPTVFVHGDLWQGNVLFDDGRCSGVIDWEVAGAGHPGVDLGCLRWDGALLYGDVAFRDEILAAWEEAIGQRLPDIAYWDAVAALNVPSDLAGLEASYREHGRGDVDGPTLDSRRDAFLEDALSRMGRSVRARG